MTGWDHRELTGPFDLVGDVHGCLDELVDLLVLLGWEIEYDGDDRPTGATHPARRTAVLVGDLVDRGPATPGVLRLVAGMLEAGTALCVQGNHEAKLVRALRGAPVSTSHGLALSLTQLAAEPASETRRFVDLMNALPDHVVLDGGRLVVAHAGLVEHLHGRPSGQTRSFALYGDVSGRRDELGLPVRRDWSQGYRGEATVVYGHTPVSETRWVNGTLCLDTGVVFGGRLTALRHPEGELVSVPAHREWAPPPRALAPR